MADNGLLAAGWALPPVIGSLDLAADVLRGTAGAGATVLIYVDGMPKAGVVTANASGAWSYALDPSTSIGQHFFGAKQIGPTESALSPTFSGYVDAIAPGGGPPGGGPTTPTPTPTPTPIPTPTPATDLQIAGTSHLPSIANGYATDGIKFDVRVPFYVGSGDASKLVLSWLNWGPYSDGGKTTPYTVTQVAIEKDGGGWAPVTFDGGARAKTIDALANDVQTDAILPGAGTLGQTVFKQGDLYWVRFHGEVAAPTDTLPLMWQPIDKSPTTGAGRWSYSSGTGAAIDGTGAFTGVEGKVYSPYAPAPVVLGEFTTPVQSYFGLGDSIMLGTAELIPADTLGTRGFFERAMAEADQAYLTYAVSGINAAHVASYTPWAEYAKYTTTAVEALGFNDASASAAAIEARLKSIWDTLQAEGVDHILRTDIPPGTTSADSWATAAAQAYRPGFGPGSTMDAVRQWLAGQVGGEIDAVVPLDVIRDPVDPWKYATDGHTYHFTADGAHPNTLANILMADTLGLFI